MKKKMRKPDFDTQAKREPFKMPEGYLEGLTEQIMSMIPEEDKAADAEKKAVKVPFWKTDLYLKVRPYIYLAAMMSGLYFGIWVYKYQQRLMAEKAELAAKTEQEQETKNEQIAQFEVPETKMVEEKLQNATDEQTEEYIDEACDYMMTDNHDIVEYLTDDYK